MAQMGDARTLGVTEAASRLGLSRQAVQLATARLEPLGLASRDPVGRWEIDLKAVEHYEAHRSWPRVDVAVSRGVDASILEQAELRVALATAGEHAAELRARDVRLARQGGPRRAGASVAKSGTWQYLQLLGAACMMSVVGENRLPVVRSRWSFQL